MTYRTDIYLDYTGKAGFLRTGIVGSYRRRKIDYILWLVGVEKQSYSV